MDALILNQFNGKFGYNNRCSTMTSILISKSLLERLLDKRVLLNEEEYLLSTEKNLTGTKLKKLEIETSSDQNATKKDQIKNPKMKIIKK